MSTKIKFIAAKGLIATRSDLEFVSTFTYRQCTQGRGVYVEVAITGNSNHPPTPCKVQLPLPSRCVVPVAIESVGYLWPCERILVGNGLVPATSLLAQPTCTAVGIERYRKRTPNKPMKIYFAVVQSLQCFFTDSARIEREILGFNYCEDAQA